jgi:hypothetical protein
MSRNLQRRAVALSVLCAAFGADALGLSPVYAIAEHTRCCPEGAGGSSCDEFLARSDRHASELQFVCSHKCAAQEPELEEKLSPWWNVQYDRELFTDICGGTGYPSIQFLASVVFTVYSQRLYVKQCNGIYPVGTADLAFLIKQLLALLQKVDIPNVQFAFHGGDTPGAPLEGTALPLLSFDTSDGHYDIPWPTPSHAAAAARGPAPPAPAEDWERRDPRAYWRGQLDGPFGSPAWAWPSLPRATFMRAARSAPKGLFDVG